MAQKLTAAAVKRLGPGVHADAACTGLYLSVHESGRRSWVLRTSVRGRRVELGLGSAELVTLAEARESARELRAVARAGGDPRAHRDRRRLGELTVRDAVTRYHAERIAPNFKDPRSAKGWLGHFERHVFPEIGDRPVSALAQGEVLHVLEQIGRTRPATAATIRQRFKAVMERARVAGHVTTNVVDGVEAALPKLRRRIEHREAVPWQDAPEVFQALMASATVNTYALAFVALTAARSVEVRGATWDEIDEDTWLIPAARMKANRPHVVPLSGGARAVLERVRPIAGPGGVIFPGARSPQIGAKTLSETMRRFHPTGTVHGWRACFRDWCFEAGGVPRELAEAALAHQPRDQVEAAYRRGSAAEARRPVMEAWSQYLFSHG